MSHIIFKILGYTYNLYTILYAIQMVQIVESL